MTDQFSFPGFESAPALLRRVKAPKAAQPRHSIFFAIRPWWDDLLPVEAKVAGLRRQFGTARTVVKPERLHITCCDLGGFDDAPPQALIEKARDAAAALALPPFEITFERAMRFNHNGALVLLERTGVTPLTAFRDRLDQALIQAGVPVDVKNPLHMTLAYGDGAVSETLPEPIRWKAQEFVLLDSLVGQTRHEELGCWPLLPAR